MAYAAQSKLGQAFDFTGGTHLEVPDAPTLHFVRFTTAAWVNFRSATRVQGILSKATQPGAPESFALWYADGQLRGRAGGPSPDAPAVAVAFNPAPGAWYHVAYRFDGETNALFLDGGAGREHRQQHRARIHFPAPPHRGARSGWSADGRVRRDVG
ncbi:MAG: LamG domain-containing protein [Verrucomicrobia bacterium]|nr:LamG domain-containing protein [Verrucomicrobiota bacterium]